MSRHKEILYCLPFTKAWANERMARMSARARVAQVACIVSEGVEGRRRSLSEHTAATSLPNSSECPTASALRGSAIAIAIAIKHYPGISAPPPNRDMTTSYASGPSTATAPGPVAEGIGAGEGGRLWGKGDSKDKAVGTVGCTGGRI